MICDVCGSIFDPTKDFYITINERKSASVNVCSTSCFTRYMEDDCT